MNKFIKENRKFWSQFKVKNSDRKLLIEEPEWAMITHANALFAMIINQAKSYIPVWLCGKIPQKHQLIQSYFPNTEFIVEKRWLLKLYAIILALPGFAKILFTKDILGFRYDKVKYGDIVYDVYLFENKVATIKKIDLKILKIIAKCIFRHLKIKNILQNGNYAGVLVSHQVGISGGVMLRCALRHGYCGYLRRGDHQTALQYFEKLDEVYNYAYKASPKDVDKIIAWSESKFKKVFLEVLKKEIASKDSEDDPAPAFSKSNKYYTNRASFNKEYKLNQNKKNVFIMLHAFNDYPHSSFRWMIFKDYYDWFIQTLKFAKKNNKVNWIFKQHPSIKYYITKDVNYNKLFANCPNNIIYIDENRQIDTRSLIYCADLIVTCLGSAGFELPAMGAIPSVTSGDNFYTQLGFALEPKTKKEYFKILDRANKIEKLTPKAQKRARAAYIYIYKISRVNVTACPRLPYSQVKGKNINEKYWNKILNQYSANKNTILKEFNSYIKAVKKPGFKKLTTKT